MRHMGGGGGGLCVCVILIVSSPSDLPLIKCIYIVLQKMHNCCIIINLLYYSVTCMHQHRWSARQCARHLFVVMTYHKSVQ